MYAIRSYYVPGTIVLRSGKWPLDMDSACRDKPWSGLELEHLPVLKPFRCQPARVNTDLSHGLTDMARLEMADVHFGLNGQCIEQLRQQRRAQA